MKIFVIILNWNGKNDTLECLNSLKDVPTPHQIVIVDNGSTDGSIEAFKKEFPTAILLETGENLGYAGGNNIGIEYALRHQASHILILNNDTIVEPCFLEAFLEQGGDILGAKTLQYGHFSKLEHVGGIWNPEKGAFDTPCFHEDAEKWNFPWPLDYVSGSAIFAKAEVFEKVGLFEPRFFLCWEEIDWCTRAIAAGYQPTTCPKARIAHKGSVSFTGGASHQVYFVFRNRLFWIERNCSKKEIRRLYFQVLIPEIFGLLKNYMRTLWQLFLIKCLRRKENALEKQKSFRIYKAALVGVKDYFFRRFGNGPSWIFKSL